MTELEKRLSESGLRIYSAEVCINGDTVLSYAPGGDIRRPLYSVTKSILSTAFAIAGDEGKVSVDMPLADFLESRYTSLMSQDFKVMPFKRFMTMTAGVYPFRPEGENWLENIAALETDYSDTSFHYSNIPAYLVGAALENAVGDKLIKYLDSRLFEPLDIPEPPFLTSPEGHFYGATGMELSAHELVKLGTLYLQKGVWQGERLISEESIKRAVTPYVPTERGDCYGLFFRVDKDCFAMVGKWGQRCMVFPEKGAIVAYLSHNPKIEDDIDALMINYVRELVNGQISP